MSVRHSTGENGAVQITAIPESFAVRPRAGIHLLLAGNPGPLSLAGTNTWVFAGRQSNATVVVDPGPPLEDHLTAIRALGRPAAIVLTHHHLDHSEAAPALAAEFDAPVYAALPNLAVGTTPLTEGEVIDAAGWQLTVLATPGHTSDSVCLAVNGALFTGDTLLGGSTTMIAPPTGSLADYFATMSRLSELADTPGFPGHGPAFSSVGAWAAHNVAYREERLAQLVASYNTVVSSATVADLVGRVAAVAYGDNGRPVAPYVEAMTAAQLEFLRQRGDIAS